MEPVGAGSLQLAFEQLKARLKAEGLFDAERKRPLPAFPRTVGIVTSPTGAVIRDFLNIVARRHSGLSVLLCPVSVQGDSAPAEIEAALAELNASGLVDVIVAGPRRRVARRPGGLQQRARGPRDCSVATAGGLGHRPRDRLHHCGFCRRPARSHALGRRRADYRGAAQDRRAPGRAVAPAGTRRALPTAASPPAADAPAGEPRRGARECAAAPAGTAPGRSQLPHGSSRERRNSAQHQRTVAELAAAVLRHDPRQGLAAGARTARRLPHAPGPLAGAHAASNPRPASARSMRGCTRFRRWPCWSAAMRWCSMRRAGWCARRHRLRAGDKLTTRLADGAFISRVESAASNNQPRNETMTAATARKLFGTDGIRAVAGEYSARRNHDLSPAGWRWATRCARLAAEPKVILGRDTRESGPWIAATLAAGLRETGVRVESAGVVPTPAVAFLARTHGFQAGVVISASHNPWQDNGIKLFGARRLQAGRCGGAGHGGRDSPSRLALRRSRSGNAARGRGQRRVPGRLHSVPHRLRAGALAGRAAHCGRLRQRRGGGGCAGALPAAGRRGHAAEHRARRPQHQLELRRAASGLCGRRSEQRAEPISASPSTATPTAACWPARRTTSSTATRFC